MTSAARTWREKAKVKRPEAKTANWRPKERQGKSIDRRKHVASQWKKPSPRRSTLVSRLLFRARTRGSAPDPNSIRQPAAARRRAMKRCLLSRSIARNFKANGTTLFFYKYDSYFCALPKTISRERAGTAIRLAELFGKNRMKALEDRFDFFCHFCKDRFALLWIFMRPSHAEFQMGFPRGRRGEVLSVRCTRDLVRQHLVKNGREAAPSGSQVSSADAPFLDTKAA